MEKKGIDDKVTVNLMLGNNLSMELSPGLLKEIHDSLDKEIQRIKRMQEDDTKYKSIS